MYIFFQNNDNLFCIIQKIKNVAYIFKVKLFLLIIYRKYAHQYLSSAKTT